MNPALLTTARWHMLNGASLPWGQKISDELIALIGERLGYPAPSTPDHALLPIASLPPRGTPHKIALVVGHARPMDEGNVGAGGVSEEEYNTPLVKAVSQRLVDRGIETIVVTDIPMSGYEAAMRWLAKHLSDRGATAAIEFHFNAYNRLAKGREVLHWERSVRGVTLAKSIMGALDRNFPRQVSRGLKPRTARDRGALFLSLTACPACIVEPFFGDNPDEWRQFDDMDEFDRLVDAYVTGIVDWTRSNP